MKLKILLIALFSFLFTSEAQNTWMVDPSHSSVQFAIDHLVISEVTGFFKSFGGKMTMKDDDLATAQLAGLVEVQSIDTQNSQRDGHLKSPEFFDAASHAEISFNSTQIEKQGEGSYQMQGDLTIKGTTKQVLFDVTYRGTAKFMGQTKTGIKATTSIDRTAFGLQYNPLLETGGAVVGKEVRITLNFELVKT